MKTIISIFIIIVCALCIHAFLVYKSIAAEIGPLIGDQSFIIDDGLSDQEIELGQNTLSKINTQISRLNYYRFLPGLRGVYLDTDQTFYLLEKIVVDGLVLENELHNWQSEENFIAGILANVDASELDNRFTRIALLLSSLNSDFQLLSNTVDSLGDRSLLAFASNDIDRIYQKVNDLYLQLNGATKLFDMMPYFIGYPEPVTYLLLFQNNHEIRATGGFIGSYGIVTIDQGKLVNLFIDDIYHLDHEVVGELEIIPPQPIRDYLGVKYWYMRDANWYPDFPTSARKVMEFYELEGGIEKLNGVISITPDVVSDLLVSIGDLVIEDILYSANDFTETLQYEVEQNYAAKGLSHWDRKDVIDRLASVILDEIFSMSPTKSLEIVGSLSERLVSKDIILYMNDTEAQKYVVAREWDGSVRSVEKDFLMVVDSNMAALKTNQHIDRSLTYNVFEQQEGLYGQLYIDYDHSGDFAWDSTRYRTYTRVYVPQGSTLVDYRGAMVDDRNDAIGSFDIYDEAEKTVFGAFIAIEPGQKGRLELLYRLPDNYQDYSLYYQRQPGIYDSLDMTYFDQQLYSGSVSSDTLVE